MANRKTTCIFCRARLTWLAHLFKACFKQHHRELRAPLSRFIGPDAVVFDVGAHAGQFAKLFAGMAPQGKIFSIEPGAYALSILRPALRINRLSHVTVIETGLSDTPGEATLNVPVKQSGSIGFGLSHIGGAMDGSGLRTVEETIPLSTIDVLAAELKLNRLNFIKADIEGWEMRMLAGGDKTLRTLRPVLFLEVNNDSLSRAGDMAEGLLSYMAERDYRAFLLTENGAFEPVDTADNADLFFVPAEKAAALLHA